MSTIVSRESNAVTPHPLKLGVYHVNNGTACNAEPYARACGWARDLLVAALVGDGHELVVREGVLLVAMISMSKCLFDLCCSTGPNLWRLGWPEKKVLGERYPARFEVRVVESGEDDRDAECEEGETTILTETKRGKEVS